MGRRKGQKAICHPELPHRAFGLCHKCYFATPERRAKAHIAVMKHNLRRYGLTDEIYNELSKKQDHKCAICHKEETAKQRHSNLIKRLAVDHCHTTGDIRGLLCSRCNMGIGMLFDNEELLKNAVSYLESYKERVLNETASTIGSIFGLKKK